MSIAAHGIGVKSDKVFYCLRSLMFRGDVLNLLINKTSKTIYLVPERNEKFYYVTNEGEQNHSELPIYKKYSLEKKKELIDYFINLDDLNRLENTSQSNDSLEVIQNHLQELKRRINLYESKNNFPNYRWFQKQWKEAIIKSVALQLNSKNILRCAISGVTTDNRSLEYLFIASHIKSYASCVAEGKWDEAFDPNNGLILISNVDKLFDQHDITIKQNGDLHLSKVSKCLLGYKIILPKPKVSEFYMSNDRKKYLIFHEKNFRDKHHL